jgi:hypothetical protein
MRGDGWQDAVPVAAAFVAVAAAALLAPAPRRAVPEPVALAAPAPETPAAPGPASPAQEAAAAESPADAPSVPTRTEALQAENEALRESADGLARENEQLREHLSAVLGWILANFRGRYPVPERLVGKLDVHAVSDDFTLHEDLAEMLRITPEERESINAAFLSAREMVQAAEEEVLVALSPTPEVGLVEIPPYEERGTEVRRHLIAALESALGSNRAPWAASAAGRDLERKFGGFGRGTRTIRFELVYGDGESGPVVRIRDQREMPDGEGRRRIDAVEMEGETVPPEYQPYASRLPGGPGGG